MDENKAADSTFRLLLEFTGASADRSSLDFEEYAESLHGWHDFFRLASDLRLRSDIDFGELRLEDVLEIRVTAERQGSFLTVLEFVSLLSASEWVKKGANQTYDICIKRLKTWYHDLSWYTSKRSVKLPMSKKLQQR